jgi:hypothetical protein
MKYTGGEPIEYKETVVQEPSPNSVQSEPDTFKSHSINPLPTVFLTSAFYEIGSTTPTPPPELQQVRVTRSGRTTTTTTRSEENYSPITTQDTPQHSEISSGRSSALSGLFALPTSLKRRPRDVYDPYKMAATIPDLLSLPLANPKSCTFTSVCTHSTVALSSSSMNYVDSRQEVSAGPLSEEEIEKGVEPSISLQWTQEDLERLDTAIRKVGKNFTVISRSYIPWKTTSEIVDGYYRHKPVLSSIRTKKYKKFVAGEGVSRRLGKLTRYVEAEERRMRAQRLPGRMVRNDEGVTVIEGLLSPFV